jgi:GntR family transcriptional repressor for pyruvate dehydrogenase complex
MYIGSVPPRSAPRVPPRKPALLSRAPAPRQAGSGPALRKADQVARELLRRIAAGELVVGSILPREDELAAELGVNRSVIREAIKLLEVHRLVRPVRRRGTEVLDPLGSMSPEVLRALVAPRPGQVDVRMLRGLLEVRAELDVQMSALAAERRTAEDLDALEALLARMDAARHDGLELARLGRELPFLVARATHNPVFLMLAHWNRTISVDLDELFQLARPPVDAHLTGLRALLSLLAQRDVEGTRAMVRAFHEWATPRMLAAAALSEEAASFPTAPPAPRRRAGRR